MINSYGGNLAKARDFSCRGSFGRNLDRRTGAPMRQSCVRSRLRDV